MTTLARARKIALGLPEATEQDHHGMASFRVRGKIFATVPDDTHLRVMVDEMEIRAAAAADPDACQELYWGKRLACAGGGPPSGRSRRGGGTAHRRLDPQGTQEAGERALCPLTRPGLDAHVPFRLSTWCSSWTTSTRSAWSTMTWWMSL